MPQTDSLSVSAADLVKALKPCGASKKRNALIELTYDPRSGCLVIVEARHEYFRSEIPVIGSWTAFVQVNGPNLLQTAGKYPPATMLELSISPTHLELTFGRSRLGLPRLDKQGPTLRAEMPVDKRHKGKVEPTPNPAHLQPRGDTWDFSAQVPFPVTKDTGKR